MLLNTLVTIDGRTNTFQSSSLDNLGSNLHVSLQIPGVNDEIYDRLLKALASSDIRRFRFSEGGVIVETDEVPVTEHNSSDALAS